MVVLLEEGFVGDGPNRGRDGLYGSIHLLLLFYQAILLVSLSKVLERWALTVA